MKGPPEIAVRRKSWSNKRIMSLSDRLRNLWRSFVPEPPGPPLQVLEPAPNCSVCDQRTVTLQLIEDINGWCIRFQGVEGSGNGNGDPISSEEVQTLLEALRPPYNAEKIQATGFYDDFGFCIPCEKFYCGTHWQISRGLGTCPAGHPKSLDPHWSPDFD